jgi:C-terminal peptidase prc
LIGGLIVLCVASTLCAASASIGGWAWKLKSYRDEARHLRILDELWEIVDQEYVYPDFNGLDWKAVGETYRARVEAGMTNEEFWLAMDEMILELGDDHSVFLSPQAVAEEDSMLEGELDYVGIGISSMPVPEKSYSVILIVLPNSPAEEAGLKPHDRILAVDGHEACCDPEGYDFLYLLSGPENTRVEMVVQTPGSESRTLYVQRARIQTSVNVQAERLAGDIGYILIPTFWDNTTTDQVQQALEGLVTQGELAGLILDMRVNAGGSETVLNGVLSFFTEGNDLGHYVSRSYEDALWVQGRDVGGSQEVPLVILVGPGTVSFAEVFSGVLQEDGRAQIVGNTTLGNVEILYGYDFEDGSRAWIATETFRPPSGTNWEQTGIVPDVEIPATWDEFTAENDPHLEAALDLLLP